MKPDSPEVQVKHILINHNVWTVETAPMVPFCNGCWRNGNCAITASWNSPGGPVTDQRSIDLAVH